MNNKSINDCVEMVELSEAELAQIEGGSWVRVWQWIQNIITGADGCTYLYDAYEYVEKYEYNVSAVYNGDNYPGGVCPIP